MTDNVANEEYVARIKELYASVRQWVMPLSLKVEERNRTIQEQGFPSYTAPELSIATGSSGKNVCLVPVGHNLLGAHGRVDLIGPVDTAKLTFFRGKGPTITHKIHHGEPLEERTVKMISGIEGDGWYWVDIRTNIKAQRLDEQLLRSLLEDVSGYGDT